MRRVRPLLALALALAAAVPAAAQGEPKKLKTDSPIRQKRVKEFLGSDAAKRKAALEESARWMPVPAAAAAKELDLLRRHHPARPLPLDAKKQVVRRRAGKEPEKYKVGEVEFEYQWAVPKEYDGSKPAPLLIYLHGSNGER